jgi:hypothetical protein
LPRKGSFDVVTKNDLLIVYHLLFGERMNLPFTLIHHMIATAQSTSKQTCVPYGMLLSKVFRELKVPLEDEQSVGVKNVMKFGPKNIKHMKNKSVIFTDNGSKKRKRNDFGDIHAYQFTLEETHPPNLSQEQTVARSPVLEERGVLLSNFQTQASSIA